MNRFYLLSTVFLVSLLVVACQTEAPQDVDTADPYTHYGEEITAEGALPVQAVVAERDQYVGQQVKLEGTIAEVCQARGCWLTLGTAADPMLVRVLTERDEEGDPKYTVAKDLSGRRAILAGVLSEEEAEEEGESQLVLSASGILVEET